MRIFEIQWPGIHKACGPLHTYAWPQEMVKMNTFIIQLDKWKQLIWMFWYIDSLLKSRQNSLQVGSMAISILMSCFIYTKEYCFNQGQGRQHESKWQNPVGIAFFGARTGDVQSPSRGWCLPVLGIHRWILEETPSWGLPWIHTHQTRRY